MRSEIRKNFENKQKDVPVRLNKFLSEAGVCSRREADKLIEQGKIFVDGEKAVTGMKVTGLQEIKVGNKIVNHAERMVLIAVHKPAGVICTTDRREKANIVDYVGYHQRIYPIGRLDKDSEGLILMTNNGDIVNKMMKSSNEHEKEYVVRVNKPVTDKFLKQMAEGVHIQKTEGKDVVFEAVTKPCQVERVGKDKFRIILTQGLNRQIRRMCEALGYKVVELKRVRIMNIKLGGLKIGTYRNVTEEEMNTLYELLEKPEEKGDNHDGTN